MKILLTYRGDLQGISAAKENLLQIVPTLKMVKKTDNLFEAIVDELQKSAIEKQNVWEISIPTYADINPPRLNLKNIRIKFDGEK